MQEGYIDLIRQYEVGADVLEEALHGTTVDQLDQAPQPGKWSIRQIVAHLADTEVVLVHRMRTVMAEGQGLLAPFDQDRWVDELAAKHMPVAACVGLIRSLRMYHAASLNALSTNELAAVLQRTGEHATDGPVTALQLLDKAVKHLHHHVRQIDAIRRHQ